MPIPKPNGDESQDAFVSRCMSAIGNEYKQDQALAICYGSWKDSKKDMNQHELLLKEIRERQTKQTAFNEGILTADRYVKTISECVGSDLCYRYAATKSTSFDDIVKKAANVLTYNNQDMIVHMS